MTSPKNKKLWNWQRSDWPEFRYSAAKIAAFEQEFLQNSGIAFGISSHLSDKEKSDLKISLISNQAFRTSSIEGQILDRDSLQSSIKRHFSLKAPSTRNYPAENDISEMMIDLYHHYALPLTDEILWSWNAMLMNGRRDLQIGQYRAHKEAIDRDKKHYYAALANQNWDNAITPWIIYLAKTSASTATRDLHDLVDKNILVQTGERKSTRYWLAYSIDKHNFL